MNWSSWRSGRFTLGLAAGLVALTILLGACGGDEATPTPTGTPMVDEDMTVVTEAATVVTASHSELGTILADAEGRTLYMFANDERNTSNCIGPCIQMWPPLLVEGGPTAGQGVSSGLLGTLTRLDGSIQVTYNGHPLYRYAGDVNPGDTNGQGLVGRWFVVPPDVPAA